MIMKNNKIPVIKFKPMDINDNITLVKEFYFLENDSISTHEFTLQLFPKLRDIDNNISKERKEKIIDNVVREEYKKERDNIIKDVERYNGLWKDYNDKYFNTLCEYFGVNFPDDLNVIDATVGLLPVNPRFLDSYSFSICCGEKKDKVIETCAHETLHFIWFIKWRNLFPNTKKYEMDSPYLVWKYSEMVTDPILNNKPFDTFNFREHGYDNLYKIMDGNIKVMDKLRELYSKDISIEEKIKDGFEYIKKI